MGQSIDKQAVARIAIVVALFAAPNIATVVGGFQGFYTTYAVQGILVAVSIPLVVGDRGLGTVGLGEAVSLSIVLISVYTVLGLVWGFGTRPTTSLFSTLANLALLAVNVLSVEIARRLAMTSVKRGSTRLALAVGIAIGIFLGETLPAQLDYIADIQSSPLLLVKDLSYGLVVSLLHVYGGFATAAVFRLVSDGYWAVSPIVLDTSRIGFLWNAISTMVYYGIALYVLDIAPRLRGYAASVFRLKGYRKYLGTAAHALLYVVIALLLASLYTRTVPLVVASGSMSPHLEVGDIILVDTRRSSDISLGDVIAFKFGKTVVVHRVVKVLDKGFRTKGDANPGPDPYIVSRDMVIGKVVASIPRVGLLALLIQGGVGALQLSTAAILVAISAPPACYAVYMYATKRRIRSRPRRVLIV